MFLFTTLYITGLNKRARYRINQVAAYCVRFLREHPTPANGTGLYQLNQQNCSPMQIDRNQCSEQCAGHLNFLHVYSSSSKSRGLMIGCVERNGPVYGSRK